MKPVLVLLSALTFVTAAPAADREPTLDGKSRSEWVAALKEAKTPDGQLAAVFALRRFGGYDAASAAALLALVRSPDGDVKVAVTGAVAAMGPKAIPHLLPLLRDEDEKVAFLAGLAVTLMDAGGRPAAAPLVSLLGRKLPAELRERIATWLVKVQNRDAIPALVGLLKSDDAVARLTAAHALFHLEAEVAAAVTAVAAVLPDLPPDQRARALLNLVPAGAAAVPTLTARLADAVPAVRFTATQALARLGPAAAAATPKLLDALAAEKDERVTGELAEAVWRVGRGKEAVPAFRTLLDSKSDPVAVLAAKRLWHAAADPKALDALKRLATDPASELEMAFAALDALADIGPPAARLADALAPLLDDRDRNVTTARVLGRFGAAAKPSGVRLGTLAEKEKSPVGRYLFLRAFAGVADSERPLADLPELLGKADDRERRQIAAALTTLPPPANEGLAAVRKLLESDHAVVRAHAADVLARGGRHAEAVPVLLKLLDDQDPQAVTQAAVSLGICGPAGKAAVGRLAGLLWDERHAFLTAEALGRIGPDAADAVPDLVARLQAGGEDAAVYSSACEALAEIGPAAKAAVPELRQQLKSPYLYVRVHAARAVWKIAGDRSGEGALTAALTHHDYKCRGYAAETLWFLGQDKQAVATLVQMADDYDPERGNQRYIAARALGRIGPPAKDALPVLRKALDDQDPMLVATARDAIRAINKK